MGMSECNSLDLDYEYSFERAVNGIVYKDNAHVVWMDLQERFDKANGSRIYNYHREIATISQGSSDISAYHLRLHLL